MNALEVVRSLTRLTLVGVVASCATLASAQTEGDATLNSRKPTVGIVNPWNGPVSLPFRVQARVFSPKTVAGATQDVGAVTLQYQGPTSGSVTLAQATNYGTATDSGIWQATVQSPTLVAGAYTLRASATNASGTVLSGPISITVNSISGDGNLLVRDNSQQLCSDCHVHQTHSSEAAGPKYGSWSAGCRTCHQPHDTVNASLIANAIQPPAVSQTLSPAQVRFSIRRGYIPSGGVGNPGAASYANGDAAQNGGAASGVCQTCHTRTSVFRRDGTLTSHNGNELKNCGSCHSHKKGFSVDCAGCHGAAGGRASAIAGATDSLLSFAPPVAPTT
ncbi:MAG: cytochrome c3 family protein, partial [Anaeromyxobacteraceae bacterium]